MSLTYLIRVAQRMKCFSAIAAIAICLAGLLKVGVAAPDTARPNVVFILADDLGYMDIGANNPASFYETPNIDRLAAAGMRFTQGYAACPVCSPTRASIMTGKYPPRTGITDFIGGNREGRLKPAPNQDHLALAEVTIAERFRDAGYATFFAGKWHLGDGDYSPNAQGFGPGLKGRMFYYPASDVPPPTRTTTRRRATASPTTRSVSSRPITISRSSSTCRFQAVHVPIKAPQKLVEKYEQKSATAPADAWGQERRQQVRLVQNQATYAAMIEQMDTAIGRVLAALDQAGLAERTIVVFTSDNGGLSTAEGHPTSNMPLRGGKGWPYEGGIRTPWIVRARASRSPLASAIRR